VDIPRGEPIKLGVIQALTGGVATAGICQVRAVELAIAQRDSQLLGHPIEIRIEDGRCSAEGGTIAAMRVISDPRIVGIIGTSCSQAAMTVAKIVSEAGFVMVSGLNTAPSLTATGGRQGANWQPGYFRTIYNGVQMAQAAATYATQELGITKVATIDDGDIYTSELTNEFRRIFTELGGEVVLSIGVNRGDPDMKPVLAAVASSGAELVYFPLFQPEADYIVRQAKGVAGFEDIVLLGGEALSSASFIESVGADGVETNITTTALPTGPAHDRLLSDYVAHYGKIPQHHAYAYAYDAANLLLNSIEHVAEQGNDGTLHIGRGVLRETLYATTDFDAITGRLTCDQFGDCGAADLVIVRLDDPYAGFEGLMDNVIHTYSQEH
jgi:branched-chain amino acid transport system substrate-binding protein